MEANEANRRIQMIQSSSGLKLENFPDKMKGEMARLLMDGERRVCEFQNDSTMFKYGMEYGYLLAMLDIVNGTDSVTPEPVAKEDWEIDEEVRAALEESQQ